MSSKGIKQRICPLDGKPCEKDCPDRYKDEPAGGCFLTTARELGATVLPIGDDLAITIFNGGRRHGQQ